MYLLHPRDWTVRSDPSDELSTDDGASWIYTIGVGTTNRGGSTGGSSGGSSGGGGGRGGGSTGGSSGSSGGSGGRGVTVSTGSASGLRGGSTLQGAGTSSSGQRVTTSASQGYAARGTIWSKSSPFGRSNRPTYPYFLVFGFWPVYWYYDYPDGGTPNNNTRPGGSLISATFTAPLNTTSSSISPNLNTTYTIYGDTQSVRELIPKIIEGCDAVNRTAGYNASANSTMQLYREDSFALLGEGLNATGRNTSFETCVNNTIAYNLPVLYSGAGRAVDPVAGVWTLVLLLFAVVKF